MEEIIAKRNKFGLQNKNIFRLRINKTRSSEIVFTQKAIETLGLKNKDALMFSFVRDGKYGFVWKENKEKDNYALITRKTQKGGIVFSNELELHFKISFNVIDRITSYEIECTPDNKNRFKFVMVKN